MSFGVFFYLLVYGANLMWSISCFASGKLSESSLYVKGVGGEGGYKEVRPAGASVSIKTRCPLLNRRKIQLHTCISVSFGQPCSLNRSTLSCVHMRWLLLGIMGALLIWREMKGKSENALVSWVSWEWTWLVKAISVRKWWCQTQWCLWNQRMDSSDQSCRCGECLEAWFWFQKWVHHLKHSL